MDNRGRHEVTERNASLEFLGTGTSAGVPIIGCDCNTCTSEDPRDTRLRCGGAVRFTDDGGTERVLLIDVPPDHRQQALRTGLKRCDGILVTHAHVDHVYGLDEIRRYNILMQSPISVFAEASVHEELHRIFKHIYKSHRNVNDSWVAELIDHTVAPGEVFLLHGLRIEPIRLLHGRLPILGYRIEFADADGAPLAEQPAPFPMAWCTDCSAIPPESWPQLRGLETLVLDMLRDRSHPTHMTVEEAVETAERVGAQATWFLHMTHELRHAELLARLPESMAPAWDGLLLSASP